MSECLLMLIKLKSCQFLIENIVGVLTMEVDKGARIGQVYVSINLISQVKGVRHTIA